MASTLQITSTPREADLNKVCESVREHNLDFMVNDFCPLAVFERDATGNVIAGLIATTYWVRLDIKYLWVSPVYRGHGVAKKLLLLAENAALSRGCQFSQVDTFDFQALGFYQQRDYRIFGERSGYQNAYKRHYLHKTLTDI